VATANALDRMIGWWSPQRQLARVKARAITEVVKRHYEGAATGRRTQGWRRGTSDANAAAEGALGPLRNVARDLVRNNPYAARAVAVIVDEVVGWGLMASAAGEDWRAWAETTACDVDGRNDFAGLQKLVLRTTYESGEVLVRRRIRRPDDGLPLPFQLQVLEPDYLDTTRDVERTERGGQIIQGIEFDAIGRRVAYWLFRDHPGSPRASVSSRPVPADDILHVYPQQRPGQVRGVSAFAPVILTFKDFDDLEDAILMKQKVAACLSVMVTDTDGSALPLGEVRDATHPEIDTLSPGLIRHLPMGQHVDVVQPPSVREYPEYAETQQRKLAAGLGVTFSDLTGNYTEMNFSASRMELIRHWSRVEDWRWRVLVPQFCDPVWTWAVQMGGIVGKALPATTLWDAPPMPMVDPDKEGLAAMRNIRTGVQSLYQVIRERGYNPDKFLQEVRAGFKRLDDLGIVLDCDPRKMTQSAASPSSNNEDEDENEDEDDRRARLRLARRS
jgi:lambda family phage portal protein